MRTLLNRSEFGRYNYELTQELGGLLVGLIALAIVAYLSLTNAYNWLGKTIRHKAF